MTAHPGLAPFFKGNKVMVYGLNKYFIEHRGTTTDNMEGAKESSVSPTFLFPNASITMT